MKRIFASRMIEALAAVGEGTLATLLRIGLGDRRVALCFHRVLRGSRRDGELLPKLTMPEAEIDRLIRFVLDGARRREPWLTVCFDDGYLDAAEYVLSRAPQLPEVEWLVFVCPEKTERQAGFRWDLAEALRGADESIDATSIIYAPVDPSSENVRSELRSLASDRRYALADVETCRRLQRLPNVSLGNHSNVHHPAALLRADAFRADFERSTRDFRRLFGEPRHVAFPFGVPGVDFAAEHVEALRRIGSFEIWSTEPRPYDPGERAPSAVLPRFAVDGTRTWKESAAHLVLHSLRARLRRRTECIAPPALAPEIPS
jgi:hypothetical protein